jgi:hypothetical protein
MALPSDLITVFLYRNVNVDFGGQFYLRKVYSKDEINLITKVARVSRIIREHNR